jgi:hypothetical protein
VTRLKFEMVEVCWYRRCPACGRGPEVMSDVCKRKVQKLFMSVLSDRSLWACIDVTFQN